MTAVEEMDFGVYDKLLLGGDLVYESTRSQATLKYLDHIFDLSNPDVLWTLGNHDYKNHPEWIPEVTNRPKVYSYQDRGIAYWVMDSQENNGNTSPAQKEILHNADQLIGTDISHLIVLHHKLLWMRDEGALEAKADSVANGGKGTCFYCLPPNDFYKEVYPVLVNLQKSGIQVICIAGDIGAKVNQFEHQTAEGIYFLASGLKDGSDSNKLLILEHHLRTQEITWRFKDL